MTESEWLQIGFKNGIIQPDKCTVKFYDVYRLWFRVKMRQVKPQSLDRIEVTYNKYYAGTALEQSLLSDISFQCIIDFLTVCILDSGRMTYKEYSRLLQIIRGVLTYALDCNISGASLIDWECVKRYCPYDTLSNMQVKEYAVSRSDFNKLYSAVVDRNIYPLKRAASLLLIANFYMGLRIGELAGLRWENVDFDNDYISVHGTETKFFERNSEGMRSGSMCYTVSGTAKTLYSIRRVPLVPEAKKILMMILEYQHLLGFESPFVAYDGGQTVLVRSLDRTLRKLCKLCNIPHINSHRIRKTVAVRLHENNVPTRIISDILGHSDISTTEKYYIIHTDKELEEMRCIMEQALSS